MDNLRMRVPQWSLALGLAPFIFAVATANACSPQDDPGPAEQGDASTDSGPSPEAAPTSTSAVDSGPDASTVCNALTTAGLPALKFIGVADPAPAPLGGDIEDGDYVAESSTVYGAVLPEFNGGFQRVRLTGGVAQVAFNSSPDRSLPDRTATETWSPSGTNLTITRSCPTSKSPEVRPYTVDKAGGKTTLILFGQDNGKTVGARLVKQ